METALQISLDIDSVNWALHTAELSIAKWAQRDGYYNNRTTSHFTGKLGELAVEKYLLAQNQKIDSHFRFAERENLCDLVIKLNRYKKICRIEVKTWSANYWADLGRCIAVEQYPELQKKADVVLWCVIQTESIDGLAKNPQPVLVSLAGWSRVDEISNAEIKHTGVGEMRKVKNYQLDEGELNPIETLLQKV
jgi:hypothetical protein